MKSLLVGCVVLLLLGGVLCDQFEHGRSKRFNMGRSVSQTPYRGDYKFEKEVVASDFEECSTVGENILSMNGTAVDASIASLLCLGVVNPHSSGVAGGGFMLVHIPSTNTTEMIDFREEAPTCAGPEMVTEADDIASGGLSVAVPGELQGMYTVWKKYGRLPWKSLFEPAAFLAESGFRVGPSLRIAIEQWEQTILKEPTLREHFVVNNTLVKVGAKIKNPKLARFLRMIGNSNSSDIFYEGEVASVIESEVNARGGCLIKEDLHDYQAKSRKVLKFPIGENTVVTGMAPTSGPILALMLKIFAESKLTKVDLKKNAPLVYHYLLEAMKYGYGFRGQMADCDFEPSVCEVTDDIIESDLAKRLSQQITYRTHPVRHYLVNGSIPLKTGTTHLVALDKWGGCVSVTSTINGYFGAKFASKKYGFIYNNEMDDFSFPKFANEYQLLPSAVNFPAKGKRPQSSAAPVVLLDPSGRAIFAAGGSGGSMITSAVAQVFVYHVIMGFSLKDSVDMPRLHNQLTPDVVYAENRFPNGTLNELRRYNHKVEKNYIHHAVVQALSLMNPIHPVTHKARRKHIQDPVSTIFAESDFRKGGKPRGV